MHPALDIMVDCVEQLLGSSNTGLLRRECLWHLEMRLLTFFCCRMSRRFQPVSTFQFIRGPCILTVLSSRFDRGDMAFVLVAGALVGLQIFRFFSRY